MGMGVYEFLCGRASGERSGEFGGGRLVVAVARTRAAWGRRALQSRRRTSSRALDRPTRVRSANIMRKMYSEGTSMPRKLVGRLSILPDLGGVGAE